MHFKFPGRHGAQVQGHFFLNKGFKQLYKTSDHCPMNLKWGTSIGSSQIHHGLLIFSLELNGTPLGAL